MVAQPQRHSQKGTAEAGHPEAPWELQYCELLPTYHWGCAGRLHHSVWCNSMTARDCKKTKKGCKEQLGSLEGNNHNYKAFNTQCKKNPKLYNIIKDGSHPVLFFGKTLTDTLNLTPPIHTDHFVSSRYAMLHMSAPVKWLCRLLVSPLWGLGGLSRAVNVKKNGKNNSTVLEFDCGNVFLNLLSLAHYKT